MFPVCFAYRPWSHSHGAGAWTLLYLLFSHSNQVHVYLVLFK